MYGAVPFVPDTFSHPEVSFGTHFDFGSEQFLSSSVPGAVSSYLLDELGSNYGKGGRPSSFRNLLCLAVAFWIVSSISTNSR